MSQDDAMTGKRNALSTLTHVISHGVASREGWSMKGSQDSSDLACPGQGSWARIFHSSDPTGIHEVAIWFSPGTLPALTKIVIIFRVFTLRGCSQVSGTTWSIDLWSQVQSYSDQILADCCLTTEGFWNCQRTRLQPQHFETLGAQCIRPWKCGWYWNGLHWHWLRHLRLRFWNANVSWVVLVNDSLTPDDNPCFKINRMLASPITEFDANQVH